MTARTRKQMIHGTDENINATVSDNYPFRHSLDSGDRGMLVLWAQSKLADAGFYDGPLDGRYMRNLNLAVRKFQESRGLKITGVIDRKTWEAL